MLVRSTVLAMMTIVISSLTASAAFAAPAPWQYHRIKGYDSASELKSQSQTRRIVAELVQKYNARFAPNADQIADQSDAASNAFIGLQNARIATLKAEGRLQLLFSADMKAAKERFDFFAVTDESSDLVAIMFTRQKSRKPLSESILLIRPIQAFVNGQTIQDAFDITAFYIEGAKAVDSRSGGTLSLKYATNVSYFGKKKALAERTFSEQTFEIAKANGVWVARNAKGQIATFKVDGGVGSGVSVTVVNK
ncbi:MAG: hypothetical protein V4692_08605 [Bdellovibrionota bacterium]